MFFPSDFDGNRFFRLSGGWTQRVKGLGAFPLARLCLGGAARLPGGFVEGRLGYGAIELDPASLYPSGKILMPVSFLSNEQCNNYGRYPAELSPQDLAIYFHLDDADHVRISQKRGRHNRLGFAILLGTVRYQEYEEYSLHILTRHVLMHDHWHMYRIEELWLTKDAYLTRLE